MSETTKDNVVNSNEYRRAKADGSLEMGPETDVAFHMNRFTPNYDYEAINAAYEQQSPAKPEAPETNAPEFKLRPETPGDATVLLTKIVADWRWDAMSDEAKLESDEFMERTAA